jgi:hypothetical protein
MEADKLDDLRELFRFRVRFRVRFNVRCSGSGGGSSHGHGCVQGGVVDTSFLA